MYDSQRRAFLELQVHSEGYKKKQVVAEGSNSIPQTESTAQHVDLGSLNKSQTKWKPAVQTFSKFCLKAVHLSRAIHESHSVSNNDSFSPCRGLSIRLLSLRELRYAACHPPLQHYKRKSVKLDFDAPPRRAGQLVCLDDTPDHDRLLEHVWLCGCHKKPLEPWLNCFLQELLLCWLTQEL